ncbi:hypothetical protein ES288_D10G093500v1 [Gossypium darwinii]|uniref:Uncharacterized protein n=1 Tax=Gossypium darwinii TaxID=34276 RepID=A0A5D2AX34_GOSDA|nr:hypothetical protein ES288_D10G093500v1 [Gossypium darwinii]
MQCLSFNINSSSPSFPTSPQSQSQTQIGLNSCPPQSQGNSTDGTPRSSSSSTQLSPSFNISHEYTLALQANSYNEIRSRIEDQVLVENAIESEDMDSHQLHFSINLSQCNLAFDIFLQFDSLDNPFPSPESHNFNEMRRSFSLLKEQLDQRLHKSRSRGRFLHRATTRSAICLIGTVVAVAVTAVVISTHALGGIVGLIATPLCPIYIPSHLKKKQLARTAQLDAASSGTFFHIKDLDTIVCLVDWLHASVENDRDLVRFGLERGRDIYPIYEVVKHLRNNHNKFFDQLKELEEHICLCFNVVNKFRAKLLNQIHLHQSTDS